MGWACSPPCHKTHARRTAQCADFGGHGFCSSAVRRAARGKPKSLWIIGFLPYGAPLPGQPPPQLPVGSFVSLCARISGASICTPAAGRCGTTVTPSGTGTLSSYAPTGGRNNTQLHPAARPACTSRTRSPIIHDRARSIFKSAAARSISPGSGLRQLHGPVTSGRCGQ